MEKSLNHIAFGGQGAKALRVVADIAPAPAARLSAPARPVDDRDVLLMIVVALVTTSALLFALPVFA